MKDIKYMLKRELGNSNTDTAFIILYKNEENFISFGNFQKNSLFPIASITKTIVSFAFRELLNKYNINLNANIKNFGLNFLNKTFENLTIKHLLTHHSGIKNSGKLFKDENYTLKRQLSELLMSVPVTNINEYSYSNNNYALLRFIIEDITQNTFENFMSDFFKKLSMNSTYFENETNKPSNLKIKGILYDLDENPVKIDKYPDNPFHNPSFNLITTPRDLFNFLKYVRNKDCIKNPQIIYKKSIFKSGITDCFNYENTKDGYYFHKDGLLATGFQSYLKIIPDEDLYITILSNDFSSDLKYLADKITIQLTDKHYKQIFKPSKNSPVNTNLPYGTYKSYENGIVEIFKENNQNYLKAFENIYPLKAYAEKTYYFFEEKSNFLIDLVIQDNKLYLNEEFLFPISKKPVLNKSKIARKLKGIYKHDKNILPEIEIFTEYDKENIRIFLYDSSEEFEIFLIDSENEVIIPQYGHFIINYDNNDNVKEIELDGFERYVKIRTNS